MNNYNKKYAMKIKIKAWNVVNKRRECVFSSLCSLNVYSVPGLEWWTGMVELPICSFGGQRSNAQNLISLYTTLEGPQMAPADSR